jgi:hypothetical protein
MSKDQYLQHILFRENVLQISTLHCKSTKTHIFSDSILELFWRCYSLFIYSFIYWLLCLIGVCSIHCVTCHKNSGVTMSYLYSTDMRDWLMFNANNRNISAWWSAITKHSNRSAGVANNQCNRSLIAINNVKEKR